MHFAWRVAQLQLFLGLVVCCTALTVDQHEEGQGDEMVAASFFRRLSAADDYDGANKSLNDLDVWQLVLWRR